MISAVGKTQKALTCPYHDWTYDLEGNLISVPDEHEKYGKVDKSCLGLKPAKVDIWKSMIFVHPDPDALSIAEWFGPVEPLGPERTRVHNRGRVSSSSEREFTKQSMKSSSFWSKFGIGGKYEANDAMGEDDPMVADDFTGEEIYACEQQQKSLHSRYFEAGPAANGESPIIAHQKVVLQWLGEGK